MLINWRYLDGKCPASSSISQLPCCRCKYGTDAAAAQLPSPHKEGTHYHGLDAQRRKVQIMKQYKFVLGLENVVQVDYVTEKFYQLFATG